MTGVLINMQNTTIFEAVISNDFYNPSLYLQMDETQFQINLN